MAITNNDSRVDLHADRAVDKIRVENKDLKPNGGGGGGLAYKTDVDGLQLAQGPR